MTLRSHRTWANARRNRRPDDPGRRTMTSRNFSTSLVFCPAWPAIGRTHVRSVVYDAWDADRGGSCRMRGHELQRDSAPTDGGHLPHADRAPGARVAGAARDPAVARRAAQRGRGSGPGLRARRPLPRVAGVRRDDPRPPQRGPAAPPAAHQLHAAPGAAAPADLVQRDEQEHLRRAAPAHRRRRDDRSAVHPDRHRRLHDGGPDRRDGVGPAAQRPRRLGAHGVDRRARRRRHPRQHRALPALPLGRLQLQPIARQRDLAQPPVPRLQRLRHPPRHHRGPIEPGRRRRRRGP